MFGPLAFTVSGRDVSFPRFLPFSRPMEKVRLDEPKTCAFWLIFRSQNRVFGQKIAARLKVICFVGLVSSEISYILATL